MVDKRLLKVKSQAKKNRCLSCGISENINNRKYCSVKCRQNLRQRLNARNGLLQALNTRWATFYFTDKMIYLDVVARGHNDIFRFSYPRVSGHKPSEDFGKMANELGKAWWEQEKKSRRKYLASKYVLELALKSPASASERPKVLKIYNIQKSTLTWLGISRADLESNQLKKIIKTNYRRLAKIHHPDLGGYASTFRKINSAYNEILRWMENPRFVKRRGFTDKWFYDGENKKWVQPISAKRTNG